MLVIQYAGDHCEVFLSCASSPCLNGVCTEGFESYSCACETGFTGANCETEPTADNCMADVDSNGSVDVADILVVLANFDVVTTYGQAALPVEGALDVEDLLAVLQAFGTDCSR